MENLKQKAIFLKQEYIPLLSTLSADAEHKWGKMNVHQMIEHMADSVRIANGRDLHELVTPADVVDKMRAFLMTEKPMRENTQNKLLPEEPTAPHHQNIQDSIDELHGEIKEFFSVFEKDPSQTIMNPFFGAMDYDMWVQLLHKHAWHHLRQFGVTEEAIAG